MQVLCIIVIMLMVNAFMTYIYELCGAISMNIRTTLHFYYGGQDIAICVTSVRVQFGDTDWVIFLNPTCDYM